MSKPDPKQRTLEEQAARLKWNEKDRLIREVKMKNTPKSILWILSSHIGGAGSWVMPLSLLANETGLHKKSLNRNLKTMTNNHLISVDLQEETSASGESLYRFQICWGNLLELPKCSEQPKSKPRKAGNEQMVKSADKMSIPPQDKMSHPVGQNVHTPGTKCPTPLLISATKSPPLSKTGGVGEIPPELLTGDFQTAWEEWCVYRKAKRKPVSELAAKQQLKKLAAVGPEAAIVTIHESIANDWQGLFPKPLNTNGTPNGKPSIEDRQLSELDKAIARAKQQEQDSGTTQAPLRIMPGRPQ